MSHRPKHAGHVVGPLMIFGSVSLLLGYVIELMGVFGPATDALRATIESGGVKILSTMGLPGFVGVLITALAVFGLIFALLETPGDGRRTILGVSALLLSLALIPAFAVWGIFWKPFGMVLAVTWGWVSAAIYAHSHIMPCEGVAEPAAENVIDMDETRSTDSKKRHADG